MNNTQQNIAVTKLGLNRCPNSNEFFAKKAMANVIIINTTRYMKLSAKLNA